MTWNLTHYVYRVYDTHDRLIYIGATQDLERRFDVHGRLTWWYDLAVRVEAEPYPDRRSAFAAEAVAIQEEQPAFNIKGTTDGPTLTPEDAEMAWAWRRAGGLLRSITLIDRINAVRLTPEAAA